MAGAFRSLSSSSQAVPPPPAKRRRVEQPPPSRAQQHQWRPHSPSSTPLSTAAHASIPAFHSLVRGRHLSSSSSSSRSSRSSRPFTSSSPPSSFCGSRVGYDVEDGRALPVALSGSAAVTLLSVTSPLLPSLLSELVSSALTSGSAGARVLSVAPLFHAGQRRLLFLSLASPTHSLHIDLQRQPLSSPLPAALLDLLLSRSGPPPPSAASLSSSPLSSLPSSPSSLPLLLPHATTKRRLREVLRGYGRVEGAQSSAPLPPPPPPVASGGGEEGLQYLTPALHSLCRLARPPPSALLPLVCALRQEGMAEPLSLGQLEALASHHSALLSAYTAAAEVSASLQLHVQRGVEGWGSEFRYRWEHPLAATRHRWTVQKEADGLPRLRLPPSHRVTVVEAGRDVEGPLRALRRSLPPSSPQLLGFDTETRPSYKAGVPNGAPALIQLSSPTHSVLMRVKKELGIPRALAALLVDPAWTKVGQEVRNDLVQLAAHYPDLPASLSSNPSDHGFFDLVSLSSVLRVDRGGLAGLTAGLLASQLSKAAQMSDWSRQRLSDSQVTYAALDAHVSLQLKGKLESAIERVADLVRAWAAERGVGAEPLLDLGLLPAPQSPAAAAASTRTAEQQSGGAQRGPQPDGGHSHKDRPQQQLKRPQQRARQ